MRKKREKGRRTYRGCWSPGVRRRGGRKGQRPFADRMTLWRRKTTEGKRKGKQQSNVRHRRHARRDGQLYLFLSSCRSPAAWVGGGRGRKKRDTPAGRTDYSSGPRRINPQGKKLVCDGEPGKKKGGRGGCSEPRLGCYADSRCRRCASSILSPKGEKKKKHARSQPPFNTIAPPASYRELRASLFPSGAKKGGKKKEGKGDMRRELLKALKFPRNSVVCVCRKTEGKKKKRARMAEPNLRRKT